MKEHVFHNELKIVRTQVLNAFDGLVVKRLSELDDVTETDRINVNIVYAPKQRVLYDIVNKNQHIKLPILAFTTSNIQFDKSRTFNKIEGMTVNSNTLETGGHIPQPVPINFDMKMSAMVTYNRDLDQIITCIFSNFYPYITISYKHPNINQEVRCIIAWDGNIALTYPNDINASVPYRIMADATFNVSTWIYKNFSNPYGIIHNIPTTFTSVSSIYDNYDSLHALETPETTDYLTVSGRPQIDNIYPYTLSRDNKYTINLLGSMFKDVKGVIVTDINTQIYDTSAYEVFTPFISSHRLSSEYTAFTGVSVDNLTINNDNYLTFDLPIPQNAGYLELVTWSDFGVGNLTLDTYRPSGTFQFPYSNGLEVY